MRTAFNLVRIICALTAAAALCACSAVKLGYNNIDQVAYWWLDGYAGFSGTQPTRVREDLSRLHDWHRGTELPRYTELLQKMERMAAVDVTPAQACAVVDEIRQRVIVLARQAEPAAVTLAVGLAPDQLQNIEDKYRSVNAQFRKDWLKRTPAEQAERRYKQALERSEMVYGRLGDTQRDVLRAQLERSVFDAQRLSGERQRRQQDVLQTIRKLLVPGMSLGEARTLLRGAFDRSAQSPDAGYRSYQATLLEETCRTLATLHNSTTPAQREAAVQRLRGWQRDVDELMAQR